MGRFWSGRKLLATHPNRRQSGARFALWTLSAINLLNFADRYVPSAVKTSVQAELKLSDVESSLPVTGMVLVYMIAAPIFGELVDRNLVDRRALLAGAIAFWSAATALAGFAEDLTQLIVFRAAVGVGEAAFTSIVPPMLSDFYPPRDRNMVFTVFGLAAPLGGALGFGAGALLGSMFGWRKAFFVCGAPGVAVAFLIMRVNDPARGVNDETAFKETYKSSATLFQESRAILFNWPFLVATLGMCANCFAVGAFADWYDAFLVRYTNTSLEAAGMVLAAATVVGGIGGSVLGAKSAQFYESRWKSAYFLVPAVFTIPGTLFAFGAINLLSDAYVAFFCVIVGEIFFFTYGPPMQTLSISVTPVRLRSRASGMQVFLIHILGDVISPPLIGLVSDRTGSLQQAMQLSWMALATSGLLWYAGYRFLPPLPCSHEKKGGTENEHRKPTTLATLLFQQFDEESEVSEDSMEMTSSTRDDSVSNSEHIDLQEMSLGKSFVLE